MEAGNQPVSAQLEVANTALSIAKARKVSLRKSLRIPKIYSWMWDGRNTTVPKSELEKLKKIVIKAKPNGRIYMNHCRLGKRFKTDKKMIRKGELCFY